MFIILCVFLYRLFLLSRIFLLLKSFVTSFISLSGIRVRRIFLISVSSIFFSVLSKPQLRLYIWISRDRDYAYILHPIEVERHYYLLSLLMMAASSLRHSLHHFGQVSWYIHGEHESTTSSDDDDSGVNDDDDDSGGASAVIARRNYDELNCVVLLQLIFKLLKMKLFVQTLKFCSVLLFHVRHSLTRSGNGRWVEE